MYVYGKNTVKERLNSNKQISKALISTKFKDQEIINQIKKNGIKYKFVSPKSLDRITSSPHQGIILEIDEVKTYTLEDVLSKQKGKNKVLVMLDHLEDPHNFGAIIRTCEALGIDGIIIPKDRSVTINSTVVKTSAGAIEYIPIIKVSNLLATIEKLKKLDFWIVGTDIKGEDYTKIDYTPNICLIIGNEGKGISEVIKKNCDYILTIPMTGKINSLNASVSCAIMLSEIVKTRKND